MILWAVLAVLFDWVSLFLMFIIKMSKMVDSVRLVDCYGCLIYVIRLLVWCLLIRLV